MADAALGVGFLLIVIGTALLWGAGMACLVAGGFLFVAGGVMSRHD